VENTTDYVVHLRVQNIFLLSKYRVIKKDGLNFVHLYILNYTWYVNDLHNI